jgi:plasmid stabilization system protein ParE
MTESLPLAEPTRLKPAISPFYRQTADGIDVVRILHERMDYERHIP